MHILQRARQFVHEVTDFPVWDTATTLWERFEEDHLSLTASSLTYTTTLSLVPFFAVVLSIFTAFPLFGELRDALENWLVQNLIPRTIAAPVMEYLTDFASKAGGLGLVGLGFLFFTALALFYTIESTLNAIWRVRRPRPWAHRIMIYWAALTLGPLVLGASVAMTSYVITASRSVVGALPFGAGLGLELVQILLMTFGMMLLFRFVPYTTVRWAHALAGGAFVAIAISLAKTVLGWYLGRVPTYSLIYGAFATVPILLLWIYTCWVIVLLGAVVAAYLPMLLAGVARRPSAAGWPFQLALEVLQSLWRVRDASTRGLTLLQLGQKLRVDTLQLVPVIDALVAMDWVGLLDEPGVGGEPRHVLLADPEKTALAPLVERLLFRHDDNTAKLWQASRLQELNLSQVL